MQYVLLGIGGSIGATLRYCISIYFFTNELTAFPFATLTINLVGCFVLGLLSSGLELKLNVPPQYLLALKTGLIGSFTTFSTFSVEVMQLLQGHHYFYAFSYTFTSAIFGLVFAVCGMSIGKYLVDRKKLF